MNTDGGSRWPPRGRRTLLWAALAALIVAAVLAGGLGALTSSSSVAAAPVARARTPLPNRARGPRPNRARARRPNIVFVLADDLSMNLLRFMPDVQALATSGITFENYFVSDSLCCPSRASIFTGDYPHDTGVYTNEGPQGGIGAFFSHGDERRSFNVALERAGYRTAMMGKYLNGYLEGPRRSPFEPSYVPPGWNEWDVAGWGYPEFDYRMNIDGRVRWFGHRRRDYLTDVIARRGVRFIDRSARSRRPFFLELAPFAPHHPYTPAPRDRHDFPGLTAPRPPSFDVMPTDPVSWLRGHPPLRPRQLRRINRVFQLRAQDVQSIDRMIARIVRALHRHHLLRDTYIVFSSDNGLHTGEYRLMPGKLTAFDTDIHVPLVVVGPGVPPNSATDAMTENVDLAETFAAIGGTTVPGDGHSLLGLLHGAAPVGWRTGVLVEHRGPATSRLDPDEQNHASGNPTTYDALRTPGFLYVEYLDGEREYYDLHTDPYELHNIAGSLSAQRLATLHAELTRLRTCHGGSACWAAAHVAGVAPPGPLELARSDARRARRRLLRGLL